MCMGAAAAWRRSTGLLSLGEGVLAGLEEHISM